MHIAFLNPQGNFDPADSHWTEHPDFGGQLVYVKHLALAMGRLGHRADILTRQIVDPKWPEFAGPDDRYGENPNVRILRFPCGPCHFLPKEELWPCLREWIGRIESFYRDEGAFPDLWTGHYADGGLCAAVLEERTGIPFCFTGHSLGAWKLDLLLETDDPFAPARPVARQRLAHLDSRYRFGARFPAERASMARASAIVTSTLEERYEQYQHPAYRDVVAVEDDRRFAVIPPGVDLELFNPHRRCAREEEVRTTIAAALERDIAPERRGLPAVIAWSRLDLKKNHAGLVRAFAGLAELRERANLLMITRGLDDPLHHPQTAPAEEQEVIGRMVAEIERASLWGQVSAFHLAGQDAAATLYRWGVENGAVFCLPAEYEPFGLSVIEAMATGLPVVATCHGGPQESTDGGRAGLLADPHDPHELATQLFRVLTEPGLWGSLHERGRQRVAEAYSWAHTAERYLALAEEICNGERTGNHLYPLPDFVYCDGTVELPRLTRWVIAAKVI